MLLKQQRELMELGLVTRDQLTEAMHSDVGKKSGTLQALLDMESVDGEAILSALARNYKVPYLDIRSFKPSAEAIKLCSEQLCLDYAFFPLDVQGKDLVIATDNPVDFNMLDTLRYKLGKRIKPVFARPDLVLRKIQEVYHSSETHDAETEDAARQALDDSGPHEKKSGPNERPNEKPDEKKTTAVGIKLNREALEELKKKVEEPSIIRLANGIIIQAMKAGSSDVLIEGGDDKSIVSLSVEGKLRPSLKFPSRVHQAVVTRIKMMAKLDIADIDRPQKGSTRIKLWGKHYAMDVSSQPDWFGEKVEIHIQGQTNEASIDSAQSKPDTQSEPHQSAASPEQAQPEHVNAPTAQEESREVASEVSDGPSEDSGKPLILVVDDSSSVRNLVKFVLESDGYEIVQASDGVEAWDMLQSIHPSLIVADCDMPKMTGPELVQRMREQQKFNNTPIVLLTSKRDEEDEVLGLEVGADDYIGKPVEPLKLQARIKKTLAMYARVRQAMQGD